ncbi:DUF262 domain-containing protein [Fibrobacter sp. UWP2]|uniref:GmrSD restriction endonuclease domain-containing protein n=1 Tax=Fibrobacter sp. UWP2 TaxID=1896216 RepID=UPI000910675C|nr:DUF262 domain-containing protein [Fibrobacter sp. UWP2]SHI60768.1 Protein of unknown function DUF262 [Fibrobacter sp. UWP2]
MKIELKQIKIRDLVDCYENDDETGRVVAYGGKLDIRPPYQREFIYKEKQRDAVIETVRQGFPLNVMYWALREDGSFEVIDGQQRTISICQYVAGDFSYLFKHFHNLQKDEQEKILDYELMVYVCDGTDSEKLKWFETINIAGEELTKQELRNAVYAGPWLADAKRYFSKNGCLAQKIAADYLNGSAIRQDYLETALKWISKNSVDVYMAKHQHDVNANALQQYFRSVIDWIETTFKPTKERKKIMKGVEWGELYDKYKDNIYDFKMIDNEVARLVKDDDVTNKRGIYPYVLTGDERYLSIRAFTENQKIKAYERLAGICPICKKHFEIPEMEADHIIPWSDGGLTIDVNCQMLCRNCNRRKSDK